jgi:hypothetical protein
MSDLADDTANGLLISARDAARLGKAEAEEIAGQFNNRLDY